MLLRKTPRLESKTERTADKTKIKMTRGDAQKQTSEEKLVVPIDQTNVSRDRSSLGGRQ